MTTASCRAIGKGPEAGTRIPLLVIGAGPYGLATVACAKKAGIEPLVLGEPMAFRRENMPGGMFLTGFPATKDFGPFFGFVRGCPPAATLTVEGLKKALDRTPTPA